MTDEQRIKERAVAVLRKRYGEQQQMVADIEPRLAAYFEHVCEHVGTELGDANDLHNMYEVLGAVRLLRLLRTYIVNRAKIHQVLFMGEGEWRKDADGFWHHVSGGLGQPGRRGPQVYRWEPFQVFMIVAMYGLSAWIDTEVSEGDRELLETERVNATTGTIEDLRRLCTRFVLYGPRKINKSGFAAITNVEDFMFGDFDAQVVCTANSQEQSKILFNKTRDLLLQLDPVSGRKFNGQYLSYSATEVKFQKGKFRAAELTAIPAGGKMPDGKFASRSAEDEYGSAGYTNGRSDMGQTAAVIESSMGPRREPMTVITTTASLISSGPFMEILDALHKLLQRELDYDDGTLTPTIEEDRQMCLLLEPDPWERDEEYLLTSRTIRRKINPMLGKIVQHSFYDTQVTESRMDDTKKKETLAKLFNVYQSGRVVEWVKAEQVRPLQRPVRVTDCTGRDGWVTFCGLDFSQGDDLHTAAYLSARKHPSGRGTQFHADCDAWIKEDVLQRSSIRALYEKWIADGWLHVSPGKVFQPTLFIDRLDGIIRSGVQLALFGYDKYQSKDPINALKAYLQSTLDIKNPERYVQVVSQLNSEFNAPTDDLYSAMFAPQPFITFSMSPLWPFCFGNAVLDIDGRENKRPVKRSQTDACKIDPVQAIIMALDLYERYEGGT